MKGRIEDITIRMSMIRQVDGQLVVVPNAFLFKNPVDVLTSQNELVRISCCVPLKAASQHLEAFCDWRSWQSYFKTRIDDASFEPSAEGDLASEANDINQNKLNAPAHPRQGKTC